MKTRKTPKRSPRTLEQEIADTEGKPMHETVPLNLRILRSLYLHALHACRDGDFRTPSNYIETLIRADKHAHNNNHVAAEGHPLPVAPEKPKLGFEKEFDVHC